MMSNLAVRTHFTRSALLLAAASYPVMLVWPFASSSPPGFSVLLVAAGKTTYFVTCAPFIADTKLLQHYT
jgi:hypothetical protein